MPDMHSTLDRRAYQFDGALVLRSFSAVAASATGTDTAINLPRMYRMLDFVAVIAAQAYTGFVAGTAQWTATIEVSDAQAGTYKPVASIVLDGAIAEVPLGLNGQMINEIVPNAEWIRLALTKTGTPGNVSVNAYLSV